MPPSSPPGGDFIKLVCAAPVDHSSSWDICRAWSHRSAIVHNNLKETPLKYWHISLSRKYPKPNWHIYQPPFFRVYAYKWQNIPTTLLPVSQVREPQILRADRKRMETQMSKPREMEANSGANIRRCEGRGIGNVPGSTRLWLQEIKGDSLPVRLLQSLSLTLSASREKNSISSSSYSSTMLSHCQPKEERSDTRQQKRPLVPISRRETRTLTYCSPLGLSSNSLISKNQLPVAIAHRKLEGATDIWVNSDAL
jgi:hypothetical protein